MAAASRSRRRASTSGVRTSRSCSPDSSVGGRTSRSAENEILLCLQRTLEERPDGEAIRCLWARHTV
jgi:hypothetical protein